MHSKMELKKSERLIIQNKGRFDAQDPDERALSCSSPHMDRSRWQSGLTLHECMQDRWTRHPNKNNLWIIDHPSPRSRRQWTATAGLDWVDGSTLIMGARVGDPTVVRHRHHGRQLGGTASQSSCATLGGQHARQSLAQGILLLFKSSPPPRLSTLTNWMNIMVLSASILFLWSCFRWGGNPLCNHALLYIIYAHIIYSFLE